MHSISGCAVRLLQYHHKPLGDKVCWLHEACWMYWCTFEVQVISHIPYRICVRLV